MLKEKILQYLEYKGVSKYECYQKTGITNGIFSKKEGLSEENILRFLSYYADINLEWLFVGKGNMLREMSVDKPPENKGEMLMGDAAKGIDASLIDKIAQQAEQVGTLKEGMKNFAQQNSELKAENERLKNENTRQVEQIGALRYENELLKKETEGRRASISSYGRAKLPEVPVRLAAEPQVAYERQKK